MLSAAALQELPNPSLPRRNQVTFAKAAGQQPEDTTRRRNIFCCSYCHQIIFTEGSASRTLDVSSDISSPGAPPQMGGGSLGSVSSKNPPKHFVIHSLIPSSTGDQWGDLEDSPKLLLQAPSNIWGGPVKQALPPSGKGAVRENWEARGNICNLPSSQMLPLPEDKN